MRVKPRIIIKKVKECHGNIAQAALLLGVNRTTVWRWVQRAKTNSLSRIGYLSSRNLQRKSTRPHIIHYAFSKEEESAIIQARRAEGYAAVKVKGYLHLSASWMTIHRLLKNKGVIHTYGNHIRPRYQKTTHMHLKNTATIGKLQMDVKYITPELSGLPYTCFSYAVVDIYSRYKEAVILNHLDQDGAILALMEIRKRLPFTPDFIQTDNGMEFQGRFHQYCQQTSLKHHLIHKIYSE